MHKGGVYTNSRSLEWGHRGALSIATGPEGWNQRRGWGYTVRSESARCGPDYNVPWFTRLYFVFVYFVYCLSFIFHYVLTYTCTVHHFSYNVILPSLDTYSNRNNTQPLCTIYVTLSHSTVSSQDRAQVRSQKKKAKKEKKTGKKHTKKDN